MNALILPCAYTDVRSGMSIPTLSDGPKLKGENLDLQRGLVLQVFPSVCVFLMQMQILNERKKATHSADRSQVHL